MIRFAVVKVPNELKVIAVSSGKTPDEMLKESGYVPGPFCYSIGPLYNTQEEATEALLLEADPAAGALGKPGATAQANTLSGLPNASVPSELAEAPL